MADFTSDFWSFYIAVITIVSVIGCGIFLKSQTVRQVPGKAAETTHTWDGDLTEYNNPMPSWWMWLFYITLVFAGVYLALYPGLGSYSGMWGWSSKKQLEEEMAKAQAEYGPIYEKFAKMDVAAVAADPQAREMGQRLFLNHCAQCHGSDAGGSRGFPSLRDGDWLWGGTPEAIKTSIAEGRTGMMPPQGAAVGGPEDIKDVANFVLSLSGRTHDELRAQRGKAKYSTICIACHGPEGKGNQALGAPNLTDKVWLYGGSEAAIVEAITKGRGGVMPAHKDTLGEAKVHLLSAYVYGLGGGQQAAK